MIELVKKLLEQTKDNIYHSIVLHPSKSDYDIADEFGVSRSYVYNLRQKVMRKIDYELLRNASGLFLTKFGECSDRLEAYISELEGYKKDTKTILKSSKEGGTWAEQVPLDPTDKAIIIKLQMDATKQILQMAAQPRLITIVRAMRDQNFKKPEFNE